MQRMIIGIVLPRDFQLTYANKDQKRRITHLHRIRESYLVSQAYGINRTVACMGFLLHKLLKF